MKYVVYKDIIYLVVTTWHDGRGNAEKYTITRFFPKNEREYLQVPANDVYFWDGTVFKIK